jgi:hypothetical protein
MRTTSAQQNAAGQAAPQNQSTVRQAAISPLLIKTCCLDASKQAQRYARRTAGLCRPVLDPTADLLIRQRTILVNAHAEPMLPNSVSLPARIGDVKSLLTKFEDIRERLPRLADDASTR